MWNYLPVSPTGWNPGFALEREVSMSGHLILVRATWDDEVKVWVAESPDLPGLVTEAKSLDELDRKLPGLILDLLSDDDDDCDIDVPVEVVATFSRRVTHSRAA